MNTRQKAVHLAKEYHATRIAEVGVWDGNLSYRFTKLPNLEELILVDPWSAALNSFEEDGELYEVRIEYSKVTLTQEDCDTVAAEVIEKFSDNPKVTILRMTSEEAAKQVEDESLDMVFIDAIHLYKHVKQDIELWVPKIRKGGIISGDDYTPRFSGVERAVDEFGDCTVKGIVWWKQI